MIGDFWQRDKHSIDYHITVGYSNLLKLPIAKRSALKQNIYILFEGLELLLSISNNRGFAPFLVCIKVTILANRE